MLVAGGPALAGQDGDLAHQTAQMELQAWLAGCEERPRWVTLWEELCEESEPILGPDGEPVLTAKGAARCRRRWPWRKAAYIAWAATPKHERAPKTLEELAALLGLAGAGTIRNWRRQDAGIDERIAALPRKMLAGRLADVYEALAEVAASWDPKAHQDRKLFLELMGEYTPKGVSVSASAEAGAMVDMGKLEEALRRAYGEDADGDTDEPASVIGS